MTYDLLNDRANWRNTGASYTKLNPNRLWFQVWKPRLIPMEILEKIEGDQLLRVGYFNDGLNIVAESLGEFDINEPIVESQPPCTRL